MRLKIKKENKLNFRLFKGVHGDIHYYEFGLKNDLRGEIHKAKYNVGLLNPHCAYFALMYNINQFVSINQFISINQFVSINHFVY